MQGLLVLTILSVQSSYARNIEQPVPARGVPDTIQWWIARTGSWRIKTFAIDHDIHTHLLGNAVVTKEQALENSHRHYGDIIRSEHIFDLADWSDMPQVATAFDAAGLAPRIEVADDRFAFWKPDDGRYFTQSQPQ